MTLHQYQHELTGHLVTFTEATPGVVHIDAHVFDLILQAAGFLPVVEEASP